MSGRSRQRLVSSVRTRGRGRGRGRGRRLRRLDFFHFDRCFFFLGFITGRFLKLLDGLAQTFREAGEFGAAEKYEKNDENDNQLSWAHTHDAEERGGERCHNENKLGRGEGL